MDRRHFVLRLGSAASSLWLGLPFVHLITGRAGELYPARSAHAGVWGFTADPREADAVFAAGTAGVVGFGPFAGLRLEGSTDESGILLIREIVEK